MKKNNQTHRFCQALLQYGVKRCRAMTNFVMGLCCGVSGGSAVGISPSPFCHYHYSNLTKVLEYWELKEDQFRSLIVNFLPAARQTVAGLRYYAFSHDVTKALKAHSPCLEDRHYVPTSNNVIEGNKALGVGYRVSALHLGVGQAAWCPPMALQRLGSQDDANAVAVDQIRSLLSDPKLPFEQELNLLRADNVYGKAAFLAPMYQLDSLVCVVRLRCGMKVWAKARSGGPTGGAQRIYGTQYYLKETSERKTYRKKGVPYEVWQPALCEQPADDQVRKEETLKNGRKVVVQISRWNDLLIRTKKGASMKDKPMDVLCVRVFDAQNQKPVFKRPLFVAVSGKRKNQVDSALAQEQYRERYDVEPYYRFAKNQLLMDKLQTPDVKHLDTWLRIVQTTSWLLFTAREEIGQIACPIWQKYLPKNKAAQNDPQQPLTIAQTQKAIHLLFCTFDPTPFLPQKCKKGKGRQKGRTFPQRTRFKVMKKFKKPHRKLKNQQNE